MKCKNTYILPLVIFFVTFLSLCTTAQENPITSYFPIIDQLESNGPADGYYFMGSKGLSASDAVHYITVIDNFGTPVFFRKMTKATSSFRLLPDGRLAYLNGVPRKLYILNDWLEPTDILAVKGVKPNGHDWDVSADGNILLMGEATSTIDMSGLVEGGNAQAEVLDLIVQEFDKDFNLMYTWNSADHFSIFDGNENSSYYDFTEQQLDYVHANGISVDSDTSFLISCRHMEEITKVDRRTGEIIWRFGGKNNQFEFVNDNLGFSHQHSIRSLSNGHILLFDNGNLHSSKISSAVEYAIDETNKTATLIKRYHRNPNVYSNHQGTTQRIHNGNTIVNWGPYWPSFTEFHPDGTIALEWDFTKHSFSPRIEKYEWETKVFESDQKQIDFGMWENDSIFRDIWIKNNSPDRIELTTVESRSSFFGVKSSLPVSVASNDSVKLIFWFDPETSETGFCSDVLTIASDSENQRIARQVSVSGYKNDNKSPTAQLKTIGSELPLDAKLLIEFSEPIKSYDEAGLDYKTIGEYVIFRKHDHTGEDLGFKASISTDGMRVSILPNESLEQASTYYLSLRDGLMDYSENTLVLFETQVSTVISGIIDSNTRQEIHVFPNPSNGKLTIESRQGIKKIAYEIINNSGVVVVADYVDGNEAREIDISHLETGMYHMRIDAGNGVFVKKIIKI